MNYNVQKLFIICYTADRNPLANLLKHNVEKKGQTYFKRSSGVHTARFLKYV